MSIFTPHFVPPGYITLSEFWVKMGGQRAAQMELYKGNYDAFRLVLKDCKCIPIESHSWGKQIADEWFKTRRWRDEEMVADDPIIVAMQANEVSAPPYRGRGNQNPPISEKNLIDGVLSLADGVKSRPEILSALKAKYPENEVSRPRVQAAIAEHVDPSLIRGRGETDKKLRKEGRLPPDNEQA